MKNQTDENEIAFELAEALSSLSEVGAEILRQEDRKALVSLGPDGPYGVIYSGGLQPTDAAFYYADSFAEHRLGSEMLIYQDEGDAQFSFENLYED